jgi:Matrixin
MVGVVGSKPIAPTIFSRFASACARWLGCHASALSRSIAIVTLLAAGSAEAQPLAPLGPLEDDGRVPYFIEPLPADVDVRPGDAELALWALEAWQRAAGGALRFEAAASEESALVRVYWAPAAGGQYGEMRALTVDGLRGAAVYIRPDTAALGDDIDRHARLDALFRDTIVYLTCLHELGHALGLVHTADFEDVMYFFGYGGDITEFFARYRRTLAERRDIRSSQGLSDGDREQLGALYGPKVPKRELRAAN